MGNFQRGGGGGRPSFGGSRGGDRGGRPSFGGGRGGDRGEISMHKAICDECHKSCEVPFRPSGDKPIFCNDCFSDKRGDDNRGPKRDFGGDRGPRRDFGDRPAPSFGKPAGMDDTKKMLGEISAKLDRLLNAIEKTSTAKVVSKPEVKVAPAKIESKKVLATKTPVKKVVAKTPAKKVVAKKKSK